MPPLVVTAPRPLSGKTAVAVGLGQRLSREGKRVALLRLAGDEHAAHDASLFASLPFNAERRAQPLEPGDAAAKADHLLVEAPSGDPAASLEATKGRALAVVRKNPALAALLHTTCVSTQLEAGTAPNALSGPASTAKPPMLTMSGLGDPRRVGPLLEK